MLGLPVRNVWQALVEAARFSKQGKDLERGLLFEDTIEPLRVKGKKLKADKFLSDGKNIDYRSVCVYGKKRVMRARPIVRDWECQITLSVLTDVINPETLIPIIQRAGRLVGLCEMRPSYGTFTVKV